MDPERFYVEREEIGGALNALANRLAGRVLRPQTTVWRPETSGTGTAPKARADRAFRSLQRS
jgi:hypothetical protein